MTRRKLVCACAALLTMATPSGALGQEKAPVAQPVVYYLPKHVLALEIVQKTERRRAALKLLDGVSGCDPAAPAYPLTLSVDPPTAGGLVGPHYKLCIDEVTTTSRDMTAQLRLVADLKAGAFRLGESKGMFTDQKVSVELRDGALLKSLNATSQGRFGDVLTSAVKFSSLLLGFPLFGLASATAGAPPSPTECNPFLAPYRNLVDNVRLFISRNDRACLTFKDIDAKTKALQPLVDAVSTSEMALGGKSGPALDDLIKQLKDQRKGVDDRRKQISALQEVFHAALEDFVRAQGLGTETTQKTSTEVLELFELPAKISAGSPSDVAKELKAAGKDVAASLLELYGRRGHDRRACWRV